MSKTTIPWCDEVWNPMVGCSAGCDYCYARKLHDKRHQAWLSGAWPSAPAQYRLPFAQVQLLWDRLEIPARRKKPTVFFVNSMGDLFDPAVPDEFRDRAYGMMASNYQHTYLILTKHADRMADYWAGLERDKGIPSPKYGWSSLHGFRIGQYSARCYEKIWHGVTVEDQQRADERIPHLLRVPGKRFVSIEPMLGPVDLARVVYDGVCAIDCLSGLHGWPHPHADCEAIHAVLLGGESGPNARPMHPGWVRSVRNQCADADVPFYFKQWGEWGTNEEVGKLSALFDDGMRMSRVGKNKSGRMIGGRTHDDLPWNRKGETR